MRGLDVQGLRKYRGQLIGPRRGEFSLALGKPEDGPLLGECQGKGRATGLCLREFGAGV
ncbi:hypothetical protein D3C71_1988070 [compost metagenome]